MVAASRWLLRVPDLDEIRTGAIRLTVPLVDDVIQIGLGGRYDVGTIDVLKRPARLVVRRTDGRPLQARIIRDEPITVLRAPLPHLALGRVGPGRWLVPDGVPIGRVQDLEQLVRTIATFGLAKQAAALTSAAV
jgi:hypothetical protein